MKSTFTQFWSVLWLKQSCGTYQCGYKCAFSCLIFGGIFCHNIGKGRVACPSGLKGALRVSSCAWMSCHIAYNQKSFHYYAPLWKIKTRALISLSYDKRVDGKNGKFFLHKVQIFPHFLKKGCVGFLLKGPKPIKIQIFAISNYLCWLKLISCPKVLLQSSQAYGLFPLCDLLAWTSRPCGVEKIFSHFMQE